jgi:hypothetical protein
VALEQLESDIRDLAVDFVSAQAVPVVLHARMLRDQAFDLLDGRQWPQRLAGVARRMSQLRVLLAQPRYRDSAVASVLAGRIEQFRTDLVTLADGQV